MPREVIHIHGQHVDVQLTRCAPTTGRPVVLVPGLGASPLAFQLGGQRSLVDTLSAAGRTPWLVDFVVQWRARQQDASALLHALEQALAELRRHSGADLSQVDAIGHSLGGILLLALVADGVPLRKLVTMASGLDYRLGRSPLPRALSLSPKGVSLSPSAIRPLIQATRRGGLPVRRIAQLAAPIMGRGLSLPIQRDQFHPGSTPGPVVRQMMREGVRDMPLALLLDLAELFTQGGLRLGRSGLGGTGLALKDAVRNLTLPVMMIAARQDRQCPVASVVDASQRVPGATLLVVGDSDRPGQGYGHVDLMTASRAPVDVFDPMLRFLQGAVDVQA